MRTARKQKSNPRAKRKATPKREGEYWFDEVAADHAVAFFPRFLRHYKSPWTGKPFELLPWQANKVIRPLFGWKRPDGTRRYRTVYVEVPRSNGKSPLAGGVGAYLLFADGEVGAEIYSAAAERNQAAVVFDYAKSMMIASPALIGRSQIFKRSIVYPKTGSSWQVLSADAYTKHGLKPHGVLFDEFHAQTSRHLYDTLVTSLGSRSQPVVFIITTAGYDRNSICWELRQKADRVLSGAEKDEEFLAVVYAAGEKDNWKSPRTWKKANPSLGVTVSVDFLARECARAQNSPAYENTFRRLYLNQWTSQKERWIPMDAWDKCGEPFDPMEFVNVPCYAGLDLASTTDLASLVLCFPVGPELYLLPYFWIPEEGMRRRSAKDHVDYEAWVKQGLIHATPGNVIDYDAIIAKLAELRESYMICEVAHDRYGASRIEQQLMEMGLKMVPFSQSILSISGPCKQFLTYIYKRRIRHGGNPVLRWNAENVVVKMNVNGDIQPNKAKSFMRIDGIVASIMGMDRAVRNESPDGGRSIYESRGLLRIGGGE